MSKQMRKKVMVLKEVALGSIFFPFTEPRVKSPLTGNDVGGDMGAKEKSKQIVNRLLK